MDGQPAEDLRWLRDPPSLREPVLIAAFEGWNDAGDAATIAARHLADRFDANLLVTVDPERYYDFSTTRPIVHLDDDHARSISWPTNEISTGRVPSSGNDIVVLLGLEPQLRWRRFCEQILSAARAVGARQIVTLGALLADVPHTRPVEVYGTSTDPDTAGRLDLSASSYEGPTGIVGVLSSEAAASGFSAAGAASA